MWVAFANISKYAMFNDKSFNDTLTKDVVSFEQLGPDCKMDVQFLASYSKELRCPNIVPHDE